MTILEEQSYSGECQDNDIFTNAFESLGSRLARGAVWLLAGNAVSRLLSLVASIVTARILGQTSFGEFGIITATIALFGVVSESGMGMTNSRYVSSLRNTNPDRVGGVVLFSLIIVSFIGSVIFFIIYMLTPYLASTTLNAPVLIPYLRLAALAVISGSLEGAILGALSGFEDFRPIARVNVIQGVLSLPISVIGVMHFGLAGAVGAFVVNSFLRLILLGLALSHRLYCSKVALNWRLVWQERGIFWRFSLPAMSSGLMVTPVTWWCSTILAKQVGGYAELGLFTAANQWRIILLFLPNLLGSVALPILAETWGRGESERVKRFVSQLFRLLWTFFLPVVIVLIGLSKIIMGWYGQGFQVGYAVMIALVLTAYVQLVLSLFGTLIAVYGRMWLGFLMNTGWAIVIISSAYIFVKPYGAMGLAFAYLLAYIVHAAWALTFGANVCGRQLWRDVVAMVGISTLLSFISVVIVSQGNNMFSIIASTLLGCVTVFGAWCFSPNCIKQSFVRLIATMLQKSHVKGV